MPDCPEKSHNHQEIEVEKDQHERDIKGIVGVHDVAQYEEEQAHQGLTITPGFTDMPG